MTTLTEAIEHFQTAVQRAELYETNTPTLHIARGLLALALALAAKK